MKGMEIDQNEKEMIISQTQASVSSGPVNQSKYSILMKLNVILIFETTVLPVVLYGCETWSLTLREECRQGYLKTRS